jgi:hypothetical protein
MDGNYTHRLRRFQGLLDYRLPSRLHQPGGTGYGIDVLPTTPSGRILLVQSRLGEGESNPDPCREVWSVVILRNVDILEAYALLTHDTKGDPLRTGSCISSRNGKSQCLNCN